MKKNEITLFMPGRLCIVGEHSDWASSYHNQNKNIENGYALTTKLDVGIYSKVKKSDIVKINYLDKTNIECNTKKEIEKKIFEDDFWKYALSACKYMIDNYDNIFGIEVDINKVTLPMKKGLGSSAAISLLIIRAYNILYKLKLSEEEEMKAAFLSEISIGSKCGRLDQVGVMPSNINLMIFDNNNIKYKHVYVHNDIYMVIADLKKKKDTVSILNDLNNCYPFPKNIQQSIVQNFLGEKNKQYVLNCKKLIENGDIKEVGILMNNYQKEFDKSLIPTCDELKAPFLHKVLSDKTVKKYIFGGKGCGSGGDGAVQFIAKDKNCQEELAYYLSNKLNLETIKIKIKSSRIRKAIIPIGGFGKRMYPMTKIIGKEFLPVMDMDKKIKPAILILLNELIESGVEQIGLILPKKYQKSYLELLKSNENFADYPEENEYNKILDRIVFIDDKYQDGVGHAIELSKKFIGDDDFIFLLGDQLYKSNTNESCIHQILNYYYKNNCTTLSCCKTNLNDVPKYGILYGSKLYSNNFNIENFIEKPSTKYAKKNLNMNGNYYSIFGCYIFKNNFLNYIKKNTVFTDALSEYIKVNKTLAFIPNGKYYDIGNPKGYYETFMKYHRRKK